MWYEAGLINFRSAIKAGHRSSLFTGYFMDWDDAVGRARPTPPTSWHYRSFQLFGAILTLVLPTFLILCYQFKKSDYYEKKDMKAVCLTNIATVVVWVSIPYVWFFMRESGPPRFIKCFESVLTLDKQLQGTVFIITR